MIAPKEGELSPAALRVFSDFADMSGAVQREFKGVDDLPGPLKGFLQEMHSEMPKKTYRAFESFVLQAQERGLRAANASEAMQERAVYGGALSNLIARQLNLAGGLGLFNPEEIPIRIFDRMRKDPDIAIGTAILRQPIKDLNFRIDCEDSVQREIIDRALRNPWRKILSDATLALVYGFAAGDKIYEKRNEVIREERERRTRTVFSGTILALRDIKAMHPETVSIVLDPKTEELLEVRQSPSSFFKTQAIRIPRWKTFWFANELEYGNFFGKSRYRNVYPDWYYDQLIAQFMMRYFERRGVPPTKVIHPPGKSKDKDGKDIENHKLALQLGQALIEGSVVALPFRLDPEKKMNMWDVAFMESDQRGEMFVSIRTHLSSKKLRGLFVPEIVVAEGTEARSRATTTQTDTFLSIEEGFVSDLEHILNTDVVHQVQELNFPPPERVLARLVMDRLSLDKRAIMREVLVEMIRTVRVLSRDGSMVPRLLPSLEAAAKVVGVPVEPWINAFPPLVPEENDDEGKTKRKPKESRIPPGRRLSDDEEALRDFVRDTIREVIEEERGR